MLALLPQTCAGLIFARRIPNTQQLHQETFRAPAAQGAGPGAPGAPGIPRSRAATVEPGWAHTSNPNKEQEWGAPTFTPSPAAAEPRGYGQGGRLIRVPRPGNQRPGIRALWPAVHSSGSHRCTASAVWQPAAPAADKICLASGTALVSGPLGWHGSPARRCLPDPHTNTPGRLQGSAASHGFGPAVQSSSRSCLQPCLRDPQEPRLCLHLACFPQPNVSHPPGALEMPCSPAGPQAGPSACSWPSPLLLRGSWRGLQVWWGLDWIHPARAIMRKLPASFSSAPFARSSCWVRRL